jgi:uncharacterized protein YebE (UPF0316 family)
MDRSTLLSCLLIFVARVGDVSLGTLRVVMVTQGRRGRAALLGFFEVLIWVCAVSAVLQNLRQPLFAIAYALGFATGNYVGLTGERWAALGRQVVRIFSRSGHEMAETLREKGFRVTLFEAQGRDGSVAMLYTETERRLVPSVVEVARGIDPRCYYVVDDIRVASSVDTPPKRSVVPWTFLRRSK